MSATPSQKAATPLGASRANSIDRSVVEPRLSQKYLERYEERQQENQKRISQGKSQLMSGAIFALLFVGFTIFVTVAVLHPRQMTFNITEDNFPFTAFVMLTHTAKSPTFENYSDNSTVEHREFIERGWQRPSNNSFCDSVACRSFAKELQEATNDSSNPCGDLYDYVCRGTGKPFEASESARDQRLRLYEELLLQQINTEGLEGVRQFLTRCQTGIPEFAFAAAMLIKESMKRNISFSAFLEDVMNIAELGIEPFFKVDVWKGDDEITVVLGLGESLLPEKSLESSDQQYLAIEALGAMYGVQFNASSILALDRDIKSYSADLPNMIAENRMSHTCRKVSSVIGVKKRCRVLSRISLKKLREWHRSDGGNYLAFTVALDFLPLMPARNSNMTLILKTLFWNLDGAADGRQRSCLRLLDRHEPFMLAHIGRKTSPPGFEDNARSLLNILKRVLWSVMKTDNTTWTLFHPVEFYDGKFVSSFAKDLYGNSPAFPFHGARILAFFRRAKQASWKKYLHWIKGTLKTESYREYSSGNLYVPQALFSTVGQNDFWLRSFEIATVGPAVLQPYLTAEFMRAGVPPSLKRCLKNVPAEWQHSVGVSSLGAQHAGYLMSFFISYLAFRRVVGERVVVPGTRLNSDLMFLLHYVRNFCGVIRTGVKEEVDHVPSVFPSILPVICGNKTTSVPSALCESMYYFNLRLLK